MGRAAVIGIVTTFGLGTLLGAARASVRDGRPWEWSDYNAIVSKGDPHQTSTCDAAAQNLKIPDLTCEIDHDSWDRFFKSEMQRPYLKRHDERSPWDCDGAFKFFLDGLSNGSIPTEDVPDSGPLRAELQKKVKKLSCVMEPEDKTAYVTYDSAKKTVIFHMTIGAGEQQWVGKNFKKMRAQFPALNKWWDDGHPM